MDKFVKFTIVCFLLPLIACSQTDTIGKVRYSKDFVFNDGIYLSFSEFKANKPSIKKFFIKKPSVFGNPNYTLLEFVCPDSIKAIKK